MTSRDAQEDRALGLAIFVRYTGQDREDLDAWLVAEGLPAELADGAWQGSLARVKGLYRRHGRLRLTVGAGAVALVGVLGVALRTVGPILAVLAAGLIGAGAVWILAPVPWLLAGRPTWGTRRHGAELGMRYPVPPQPKRAV